MSLCIRNAHGLYLRSRVFLIHTLRPILIDTISKIHCHYPALGLKEMIFVLILLELRGSGIITTTTYAHRLPQI